MISLCIKTNNKKVSNFLFEELNKTNYIIRKKSFKIYLNIIIHCKNDDSKIKFIDTLAPIIAESIILFYEKKIIINLLNKNYFYFSESDKKIILNQTFKYNNKYENKIILINLIKSHIKTYRTLNLSGFINFKSQNYQKLLEKKLQDSVNKFIIDKEYNEYVTLLKNYVSSRKSKTKNVNLIYINNNGLLLDNKYEYIQLDKFNNQFFSDISFSKNDYILNTLIGLLPSSITLHQLSEEDQFIKTIKAIFKKRVHSCLGCELCKSINLLL